MKKSGWPVDDDGDVDDDDDLLYNIMKHQLILFSHGHLTSKVSLT